MTYEIMAIKTYIKVQLTNKSYNKRKKNQQLLIHNWTKTVAPRYIAHIAIWKK